jgi:hypothetical protein
VHFYHLSNNFMAAEFLRLEITMMACLKITMIPTVRKTLESKKCLAFQFLYSLCMFSMLGTSANL